jgi:hypothetical protein
MDRPENNEDRSEISNSELSRYWIFKTHRELTTPVPSVWMLRY